MREKKPRPLRALPIERGTKAMTPRSKALHGRPSGPIECSTAVCFKKDSERRRGRGGKRAWKSFSWEQAGNYGPIGYQSEQPIQRGTRPVTNNYFWQPFNSQTYCPGSGQLSYGSTKLGQLKQEIHIKLLYH